MLHMISIVYWLLAASLSCAQNSPSSAPTVSLASVTRTPTPSFQQTQSPSATKFTKNPTGTSTPTDFECANNPGWYFEIWDYTSCSSAKKLKLECDDSRVQCWDYGNFGSALYNCCKCNDACLSQCNNATFAVPTCDDGDGTNDDNNYLYDDVYDDDEDSGPMSAILSMGIFVFFCMGIALFKYNGERQQDARLEANRQTMTTRRQQQRETNSLGLTEEERSHARYELFVSKFYFQTVLPDRSNISASSVRSAATKNDEEEHRKEGQDDASIVGDSERLVKSSLSRRLSSWRRPSAKDECCICLEPYVAGETICAPITTACDHAFHEGCMLQWVKNNDKCPLCRIVCM